VHLLRSHAFVSGDVVQDVTFLERVRRQAEELGLRGWVRNTEDGRVEVLLEGEAEAVRQMIEWFFSASSSGVEVHATSVFQETPSPDLVGFEIR
jgi:acylphosphatase